MALVTIRDLKREYHQGDFVVQALRGVDLDLEAGSFAALMGPSGSGKSTLLNIIGGLDEPTSGSVVVDGRDLATMTPSERADMRRMRLGFVFQAYNLIPVLTAVENAEFVLVLQGVPPAERRARAREALAEVGLAGLEDRRPNQLSGGQQQRVAIARAIAPRPAIVLADEPTANLDSTTSHELIDLMRSLNRDAGVTFLFATHDQNLLDRVDRVVRLVDGHIEEDRLVGDAVAEH
ncbi:MAG: ABC transporter ATP-binding protein [Alphaproteobacteria bacterium]|nr:ABC transporter ATP-binding protein [Alphaproteobacteria bacterium]